MEVCALEVCVLEVDDLKVCTLEVSKLMISKFAQTNEMVYKLTKRCTNEQNDGQTSYSLPIIPTIYP